MTQKVHNQNFLGFKRESPFKGDSVGNFINVPVLFFLPKKVTYHFFFMKYIYEISYIYI